MSHQWEPATPQAMQQHGGRNRAYAPNLKPLPESARDSSQDQAKLADIGEPRRTADPAE